MSPTVGNKYQIGCQGGLRMSLCLFVVAPLAWKQRQQNNHSLKQDNSTFLSSNRQQNKTSNPKGNTDADGNVMSACQDTQSALHFMEVNLR